ncbi:zgc:123305 [Trichomycterus rosablanca]|uniref:zgc:123305 n=1 Tax=Trichomycterus rosablanca TaxID=2290929 RepID=UPI002F352E13
MNYVGQLAETVFVTVKELYRGLNPATLTGGIDVIVVRQPDGSLQCSPFHVRFGKLGVLRSKEKVVDIEINGEPVDLHMKLGDNGEAFFVEENENLKVVVPAHLCTSPITIDLPEVSELAESLASTNSSSSARRKKRRKKRARSDAHLHEDASSSSEEKETPEQDIIKEETLSPMLASKSVYYSLSEEPSEDVCGTQTRDLHPHSDGECSPNESVFFSRPPSPKSDSELLVKPSETSGPQMQWTWGGFPEVCQSEPEVTDQPRNPSSLLNPSDNSHFRTIHRQASFDVELSDSCTYVAVVRPEPRTLDFPSTPKYSSEISTPTHQSSPLTPPQPDTLGPTVNSNQQQVSELDTCSGPTVSTCSTECNTNMVNSTSPANADSIDSIIHTVHTKTVDPVGLNTSAGSVSMGQIDTSASVHTVSAFTDASIERHSGIKALTEAFSEDERKVAATQQANQEAKSTKVKKPVESVILLEEHPVPSESPSIAAESEKKNDKRGQQLGLTDIYLDDLSTLDPEVVALYFPKSESESASQCGAELRTIPPMPSPQSGRLSPRSLSTGNMDSGTEYLSDSTSDSLDVTMSLCGTDSQTRQINKEKFMEHIVTYQDFANNPGIIDDPNLVISINSNYYNWAVAAPMILSMQAFQKNLPKSTVEQLVKDKMPKKSGRWWFSWRRREMENKQPSAKPNSEENQLAASSSLPMAPSIQVQPGQLFSDDDVTDATRQNSIAEAISTVQCVSQIYRKSLRLTTQQIERLNLREGANSIVFSVTTQYQGTCRCEAAIYLWNWDDKVIISDIDGTITKSDALGHILPQLGKDWTHRGIAKLYHNIHQNGYKFLYCSARAIGMADITKGYLQWVNDKGIVLPKGPVLLAPSSLFSALHREVIEKKPEIFKITCLSDIKDLFNPQRQPFYAAFGNRTNDAFAYKKVGVADSRIFTVNPKGELIQENTKVQKSTYSHLSELVDHVFPLLCKGRPSSFDYPEYSHFSYWREPLPPVDLSSL